MRVWILAVGFTDLAARGGLARCGNLGEAVRFRVLLQREGVLTAVSIIDILGSYISISLFYFTVSLYRVCLFDWGIVERRDKPRPINGPEVKCVWLGKHTHVLWILI